MSYAETNELFDAHFLFDPVFIMGSISTHYALLYMPSVLFAALIIGHSE